MELLHPEALLLVPLVVLIMRGRLWPRPLVGMLRGAVVLTLALVLAQPSWGGVDDGRDVVLVVDTSHSMPSGHLQEARELAREIASGLRAGDRIGVVAFGRTAVMLSRPSEALVWPDRLSEVDPEGSVMGEALAQAVSMVVPGRNATLLVWSDGEVREADAAAVARLAERRGIRIDVRPVLRSPGRDAAVHEIRVPSEVPIAAPFAVNAVVLTTSAGRAVWRLFADGELARSGSVELEQGRNTLQFENRLTDPGEQVITLEIEMPGDQVSQNNRGMAVVRGVAKTRVLCVTPLGRDDRLTRSLRAAGVEAVVAGPTEAPLTLGELDGFRAVVLEDVLAGDLPPGGMRSLADWVQNLGGGLLMTGGYSSFGVGGYHNSPIEAVLPVTLEIREEQRKFGLAMAIALDRSGSMGAPAGDATKMALANSGAATAIGLLSPIDAVAVLAVDTVPSAIQPLTPVADIDELQGLVRSIEPGGGGIFIEEALHACAEELQLAEQETRHVVIFADAGDAERPGDYREFIPKLAQAGVTVSVIGLGSDEDSDAALLLEMAALGGGRCQFVRDATELPRVFAQETIQVARSSLIEEPVAASVRASLQLLGAMPKVVPEVGGYSVAWPKDEAELDLVAEDDMGGPLLMHWQVGLGRSAAFMGEADGDLSGAWVEWPGYADFFGTLIRWLAGGAPAGLFVDSYRDGDVVVHQLEVDADSASLLGTARGVATAPDGSASELLFSPTGPGRVEIRLPLTGGGVHRAAVQIGEDTVRLPPMCRPYSAEWMLQPDPRSGERLLRGLARRTGGNVAPSVAAILDGPREARGRVDLAPWLVGLAFLLLLGEIAVRRLHIFAPNVGAHGVSWWRARRARRMAGRSEEVAADVPATVDDADGADGSSEPAPKDTSGDLMGALERARKRGQRRV